jgi:hypothetical protein
MNWKDVTVWQWQQLQAIAKKKEDTELDKAVKTLAILTNRTESQIDSLSISELNKELKQIDWISKQEAKPKPVDFIKVNGKRYRCIYDVRQIPFARYIESKFFSEDVVLNLHKIIASMVRPMKLTWRGWKVAKFDASKHEDYAQDLLSAPFESVYGSVVFFCQVFSDSIKSSKDFMILDLQKNGMTQEEAEMTMEVLCGAMAGFIRLQSLQNMKE